MFTKSLRARLLLLTITLGALPIIAASLFITLSTEQALVWEKQQKLFGAARILDLQLDGSYRDVLSRQGALELPKEEKIAVLNAALREETDKVASAYPGIGVGYYSKELDAIITYGPSSVYWQTVGMPISSDHQGRTVMETGLARVQEGQLVRGKIMNAMHPIVRNGETIGYIWANELTEDIQAQVGRMKGNVYAASLLGLLLGLAGVSTIVNTLTRNINQINIGITHMQEDLGYRLPKMSGELGEVSLVVNQLAAELAIKRQMEEQVQRAGRLAAVGEVAAGLAHEVRNPLMSIRGFAQLLQEEATVRSQQEYLKVIISETERLNRLIEQLLNFARPKMSRIEPVQVNEIIDSTLILLETELRQRQVRLLRESDAFMPLVEADAEQLKQVLLNIIINAMQAIGERGRINIKTSFISARQVVEVEIMDDGGGIPVDLHDRVFDPFFTTKEQGTGLGLSVAYRLMETWNGSIRIDSSEGDGASFTLIFPAIIEECVT